MTARWDRAARLSGVEFDACWELLRLGDIPSVLELPSPGRDAAQRRRIVADVLARLRQRRLADPDGPIPPLAAALNLLARPDHELDIRLSGGPGGVVVGLGAVAGTRGVVLAQRGDQFTVLCTDRVRVLPTLIELAGPMSPGTGRPVTLPADVLDDALAASPATASALGDELRTRGVDHLDATSVAHMCRGVRAVGQLGATGRARGTLRRAPWVVGFHHADTGHFLQLRRPGRAGLAWVTMCPTDANRLAARVGELVTEVSGR